MSPRRITLVLGTAAGGLLAAAFLPMAVALADDTIYYTPDTSSFDPYQSQGIPPLFESVTGEENWNEVDVTSGVTTPDAEQFTATTYFNFGPITDYDAITFAGEGPLPAGSEIDLLDFGFGFENYYLAEPAATVGAPEVVTDILITPFGNFDLPI